MSEEERLVELIKQAEMPEPAPEFWRRVTAEAIESRAGARGPWALAAPPILAAWAELQAHPAPTVAVAAALIWLGFFQLAYGYPALAARLIRWLAEVL